MRSHEGATDQVRHPAGWLRWRPSHWLLPDGTARPSPDEAAAERARLHREQQARHHDEIGRTTMAARLRAERGGEIAQPAPQQAWTPPPGLRRAERSLAGGAARPCGTVPTAPTCRSPDPEWEAIVAAAVAAEEAADREAAAGQRLRAAGQGNAS